MWRCWRCWLSACYTRGPPHPWTLTVSRERWMRRSDMMDWHVRVRAVSQKVRVPVCVQEPEVHVVQLVQELPDGPAALVPHSRCSMWGWGSWPGVCCSGQCRGLPQPSVGLLLQPRSVPARLRPPRVLPPLWPGPGLLSRQRGHPGLPRVIRRPRHPAVLVCEEVKQDDGPRSQLSHWLSPAPWGCRSGLIITAANWSQCYWRVHLLLLWRRLPHTPRSLHPPHCRPHRLQGNISKLFC